MVNKQLMLVLTSTMKIPSYLLICYVYLANGVLGLTEFNAESIFKRPKIDKTPPKIWNCPENIKVKADEGRLTTVVFWKEPYANDTKDGNVKVHKKGNKNPGDTFQGHTKIDYYARDSDGNMEACSFTIDVTATRCPDLVLGHGIIRVCTDDDGSYGSKCEFECYDGYYLVGKRKTVCQNNGTWDFHPPLCKEKQCPPLPKGKGLSYSCTKENKFQSECSLMCPAGFDIPPGENRVKLCRNDGQWKGSFPQCIDILKPRIENCKPFFDGTADKNSTRGRIYWDEPWVYDNEDKDIILHKSVEISPGDVIEAGTHQVRYTAKDRTGNEATPCIVTLSMKVLTCPRLYDDNFLSVTCPFGYRYGAQCYFSCRNGSKLVGPNVTNCVKSKNEKYVYWDFGKTQPHCQIYISCINDFTPPKNGAVACDSWLDGQICRVKCQIGDPFQEVTVCGDSEIWEPKAASPLQDCSGSNMKPSGKEVSLYFKTCEENHINQMKRAFISILRSSRFRALCSRFKDLCIPENVEVQCG